MSDFRLEVFYTVAKRLSFTKAAAELFITQPAVTKHINELEGEYKVKLFERKGNRINLTQAGVLLLGHAENVLQLYKGIAFDLNALNQRKEGLLRLGASTTVSQYIVAPLLAKFRNKFPDVQLSLITGNTEQVEKALIAKDIEIGIIEGYSKNTEISYQPFLNDELVLVCGNSHPLANKDSLKLDGLKAIRFVMREQGSGTLEVIEHALKAAGLNLPGLQVEIRLGSTESIKSYLLHSNCLAFLSIHSILKELKNNECRIIDIKGLSISRPFHFIQLYGQPSPLAELFIRFARNYKAD